MLYVGGEAEKQALLLGEPGVFFTTPGYDGWPLVMLRLAEVDAGRLEELVTDAWRMGAPDALAGGLGEADWRDDGPAATLLRTGRKPHAALTNSFTAMALPLTKPSPAARHRRGTFHHCGSCGAPGRLPRLEMREAETVVIPQRRGSSSHPAQRDQS